MSLPRSGAEATRRWFFLPGKGETAIERKKKEGGHMALCKRRRRKLSAIRLVSCYPLREKPFPPSSTLFLTLLALLLPLSSLFTTVRGFLETNPFLREGGRHLRAKLLSPSGRNAQFASGILYSENLGVR